MVFIYFYIEKSSAKVTSEVVHLCKWSQEWNLGTEQGGTGLHLFFAFFLFRPKVENGIYFIVHFINILLRRVIEQSSAWMSWSLCLKVLFCSVTTILHINFLAHVKGPFITASSVLVNHRHMNQSKRSPKAWLKFAYFQKSETCASLVDQHSLIFSSFLFFC